MYVSESATEPGDALTEDITLDDDVPFFLECVVDEATPAPTITAAWNGALTTIGTQTFTDVTSGNRDELLTAKQFETTGDYANYGMNIQCIAGNEGNTLTTDGDQTIQFQILVRSKYAPGREMMCSVVDMGYLGCATKIRG